MQCEPVLHKTMKIFIFFNINYSFLQNIFHCHIPLGSGFPMIPNPLNYFDTQKIITIGKISAMNEKLYFSNFSLRTEERERHAEITMNKK